MIAFAERLCAEYAWLTFDAALSADLAGLVILDVCRRQRGGETFAGLTPAEADLVDSLDNAAPLDTSGMTAT